MSVLAPAVAATEDPRESPPAPARPKWSADASLSQEYRFRSAGSATTLAMGPLGDSVAPKPKSDHDLRLTLDGTISGLEDRLLGTVSAALWRDLDSHVPRGEPDYPAHGLS
jgi:hypothetical protein